LDVLLGKYEPKKILENKMALETLLKMLMALLVKIAIATNIFSSFRRQYTAAGV